MNTKNYIAIMIFAVGVMFAQSCCVHEFPAPKPKEISFDLHLQYDTEMPLHTVVEHTEETKSQSDVESHDVRYIVNAYDAADENSREVLHSFVFTKDEISELNHSVNITIPEGSYRFVVWTDYVYDGGQDDLYYDTSKFEFMALADRDHEGSNDMRDAFMGSVISEVSEESVEADVQMTRPMAKFNFITTDVRNFVAKIREASESSSDASGAPGEASGNVTSLDEYTVVFRYNGFMTSAYNLHTDKTADARTGVIFTSKISQLTEDEAEMGFDYIFVDDESVVSIVLDVLSPQGELISRFKPVDVPLVRSKLTTVKANFLTSDADGGVSISPDYDDEYIIVIE